jgi:CheY-like chemotaxis protein
MADSHRGEPIDVLLVEDDEGDVLMTKEAFEYYKIRNKLHVVSDGEQALQFLRRTGPYADAPRPGLILLDVNLPRLSGLEVLAELKQDPDLLVIPVVMLTTSQAEEDILRSYALHANAFVSKPVDFEHFIEAVRQIDDFFLTLVKLPVLPALAGLSSRQAGRARLARLPGRRLLRTSRRAAPRRSAPRTSLRARK